MGISVRRPCRCGHAKDSHEHYRRGTDCATCACPAFHGRLEVTVAFGRARPAPRVVLPEEPYVAEGPWVRPTHSGGLTAYAPLPPEVERQLARPRTAAEQTTVERA